jgi:23S rRNA maturation mini-RNase III
MGDQTTRGDLPGQAVAQIETVVGQLEIEKECERINKKLENIDENNLNVKLLEECLQEFQSLEQRDPKFVSAHLGAAYVFGLLNRYDEGNVSRFLKNQLIENATSLSVCL